MTDRPSRNGIVLDIPWISSPADTVLTPVPDLPLVYEFSDIVGVELTVGGGASPTVPTTGQIWPRGNKF